MRIPRENEYERVNGCLKYQTTNISDKISPFKFQCVFSSSSNSSIFYSPSIGIICDDSLNFFLFAIVYVANSSCKCLFYPFFSSSIVEVLGMVVCRDLQTRLSSHQQRGCECVAVAVVTRRIYYELSINIIQ